MDVFGKEIPRLYSAGELGSIWGSLYPGAGNVSECIVFGRIAGRNAANETPLSG
jgi:succinate dehydrogenase/fumarate reductase flavoprotein subunit